MQLLLLTTPVGAGIAAMSHLHVAEGSELDVIADGTEGESIVLPARTLRVVRLFSYAPSHPSRIRHIIHSAVPVGNAPQFLAPFLLVSFLRHSALLI